MWLKKPVAKNDHISGNRFFYPLLVFCVFFYGFCSWIVLLTFIRCCFYCEALCDICPWKVIYNKLIIECNEPGGGGTIGRTNRNYLTFKASIEVFKWSFECLLSYFIMSSHQKLLRLIFYCGYINITYSAVS